MKPGSVLLLTLFVVLALPQCAWANAGTPLMWATALHMVFGNALIGVGEGLLLARLFSLRATKCIVPMVLANYASAWLGGLFIGGSIVSAIPMDLSNADTTCWDLVARLEATGSGDARYLDILTNMPVAAASEWCSTDGNSPWYRGTWQNFGKVPAIGDATSSPWEVWTGFWTMQGMWASNKATGERVKFSYETPFGQWYVRNAVHLPSDKVLFQLGDDQICAFDPATRRVALLWRGRGPVAVIPKPPAEPSSTATDRQP